MDNNIGDVICCRVHARKIVIDSEGEHAQGMVIIPGDILSEDNFEVVRGKGFDKGIVSDIKIVVPVCELIIACIGKAYKRKQAYSAYDE